MFGTDYIIAPHVPQGLAPAVEGLAREILRQRPRDIYTFAAHHFEKLVELRDKEHVTRTADYVPFSNHGRVSSLTRFCNNGKGDYKIYSDRLGEVKSGVLMEESSTAGKELMTLMKVRRKQKKTNESVNKSGWSITETSKVFKRYNDDLNNYNVSTREKALETTFMRRGKQYSPTSSKSINHAILLRSSSVGNILTQNINYQPKDNEQKCYMFSLNNKYDFESTGIERSQMDRDTSNAKYPKSAGEIRYLPPNLDERDERSYTFGRKRSQSLVNVSESSRNDELSNIQLLRGFFISREEQTALTYKGIHDQHNGKRKLNETLCNIEDVATKSSSRSERKDVEETKSVEDETRLDSTHSHIFSEDPTSKQIISIVLPSVVTRPQSGKNVKDEVHKSDQQENSDSLILPPILSYTLKENMKEDRSALPSLFITNDIRSTDYETEFSHKEGPHFNQYCEKQEEESWLVTDKDECRSSNNASATVQEECEAIRTKDKDIQGSIDPVTNENDYEVDEFSELENIQRASPQKSDFDESFKDSLNVTPELSEVPQRPDSLEDLDEKKSLRDVDEIKEPIVEIEQDCKSANELKCKLINIEMVDRDIESTLVSSRTIQADKENDPKDSTTATSMTHSRFKESINLNENEIHFANGSSIEINHENDDADIENTNDIENSSNSNPTINGSKESESIDKLREENDRFCYVLTEGSPCEIPETVTTVIIPDKVDQPEGDTLKFTFDKMRNDSFHAEKSHSDDKTSENFVAHEKSCKQYQEDADCSFGEYIQSEIVNYSSIVDDHFMQGIRNATERSSTHQDLENIKEEEEGETSQIADNDTQTNNGLHSSSEHLNWPDVESHKEHFKSDSMNSDNQDQIDIKSEQTLATIPVTVSPAEAEEYLEMKEIAEDGSTTSITTGEENGRKTSNNHSYNPSLSYDDGAPQVPELNLDSLCLSEDATLSTFEESSSKNLEHQSETQDGNIIIHENENMFSLSDILDSVQNVINLSSEDESRQGEISNKDKDFINVEHVPTDLNFSDRVDILVPSKSAIRLHNIEEDIAKELIQNFIMDLPMSAQSVGKTDKCSVTEEMNISGPKLAKEGYEQASDIELKFLGGNKVKDDPLCNQEVLTRGNSMELKEIEVTGAPVKKEKLKFNQETLLNGKGAEPKGVQEELKRSNEIIREIRVTSPVEGKHGQLNCKQIHKEDEQTLYTKRNIPEEQKITDTFSVRHSGELHDSVPLPLVEVAGSTLKIAYQPSSLGLIVKHDFMKSQEIGNGTSITFPNFESAQPTTPYIIARFKNFEFYNHGGKWIGLWLIDKSNNFCVGQTSHKVLDDKAMNSQSEIDSESTLDELREPLALETTPTPLMIEEIFDDIVEKQRSKSVPCTVGEGKSCDENQELIRRRSEP